MLGCQFYAAYGKLWGYWLAGWGRLASDMDGRSWTTYWTVQEFLSLIATLLHMTLQQRRVEWFQQLKTTEQLARYRHDCSPIVKLSAVLYEC